LLSKIRRNGYFSNFQRSVSRITTPHRIGDEADLLGDRGRSFTGKKAVGTA